jgi:hypothetical protein
MPPPKYWWYCGGVLIRRLESEPPVCRRKIEMSPGVQSRDDTRVPDGHEERDLDCISAGELSSAFGLPRWIGIELLH